jgi:sporulation protein YlmC with PRC-barrel domain
MRLEVLVRARLWNRDFQAKRGRRGGSTMTEHQSDADWNVADWHGKMLVDQEGEKIGKLQDVYVDIENDEPQFATVKEVAVTKEQVRSAPNIEQHGEELSKANESALYHHYELNYTPPNTESGRRLARG